MHVWRASLRQGPEVYRRLLALLTPDELSRAGRFHFEEHRQNFVVARGALRSILGQYAGLPPESLRFTYSPFGKPALAPETGGEGLRFNLSHAGGVALYAVTRGRDVGVDVESLREDFDHLEIARSYFSDDELEALRALPAAELSRAFFNCWSRKEAYIKAIGEGLSHPLRDFTVSLRPGEPAALLSTAGGPREAQGWTLLELAAGEGLAAALVVEGRVSRLECLAWEAPAA